MLLLFDVFCFWSVGWLICLHVCVCGLGYKFGVLLSMLDKMVVLWFVIDCIDHILFFYFFMVST